MTRVAIGYGSNMGDREDHIRGRVVGTAERPRLCVARSNKRIYAQVIDDARGHTLAAAGSHEATLKGLSKGEAAAEVGSQLPSGRVDVRLAGRDPELVVVFEEAPEPAAVAVGEELTGRITLRLPEALKTAVEALADQEGISTNAWLVRTIARSLEARPSRRPGTNRLQGFAQG